MSGVVICPNGHRWHLSDDDLPGAGSSIVACPMCGDACPPMALQSADDLEATRLHFGTETMESRPSAQPVVPGYEVLDLLGRGGMGAVYRARHSRLGRLVALKMIATEQASPHQLSRFQAEAQALAKLQHPHIVQIFEVGEHDGQPFISLELVEGGSLEQKLAGLPHAPIATARLMETLARAVHAAHEQGIIHRDLKPANVLLTRDGEPKIGDFGLAKQMAEETSHTQTGAIVGTPTYMAPEQADGNIRAIGPATDIYSLGTILYEMLTGRPPFQGLSTLETLELIRSAEPVPPKRLQPAVPRDLETICLKCLEKQAARRYGDALALADDLGRYQSQRPILARRAGLRERIWKWRKRHPALAALILVSVFALAAVGALGAWSNVKLRQSAERADARSRLARSVVDDMYTNVAEEWLAEEPYKDPLRQQFLEKALKLYQAFAQESGDDLDIRRETAQAHFRMGQIHRILNQASEAENAYKQSIAIHESLRADAPREAKPRHDLAASHNWLGELLRESGRRLDEAEKHFRTALALQKELAREAPTEKTYRMDIARSHNNLGLVYHGRDELTEAEKHLNQAIVLLDEPSGAPFGVRDQIHELARCLINRGALNKEKQAIQESERDYRRAIELLEKLKEAGRFRVAHRSDLAIVHQNLGNLHLKTGNNPEAIKELDKSLALLDRLVEDFPARPAFKKKLANTHNSLGSCYAGLGSLPKADLNWRQARRLFEQLVTNHPDVADHHRLLGLTVRNLGWLCEQNKDWHAARRLFELAVLHGHDALKPDPKSSECLQALAVHYRSLAEACLQLQDHAAASAAAVALSGLHSDNAQDCYFAACFLSRCVRVADADPTLANSTDRPATRKKYTDQTLAALRQAADKGSSQIERIPNEDVVFEPFRDHSEFRRILADLPGKSPR